MLDFKEMSAAKLSITRTASRRLTVALFQLRAAERLQPTRR